MSTQIDLELQRRRVAWNRTTKIIGFDPNMWRSDCYGTVMKWSEYGNRQSKYGWEIDHILPLSRGGSDTLDNLQALNWQNNAKKSDRVT